VILLQSQYLLTLRVLAAELSMCYENTKLTIMDEIWKERASITHSCRYAGG